MNLNSLLEKVNSKQTFLDFIEALKNDKLDEEEKEKIKPSDDFSSGANGWENGTISSFLDAIHAFGEGKGEEPPSWKTFALLMYAGKFYE